MDVYALKQYIIDNPELIEKILEDVGFCRIINRGNEYRCARDEGRNPTSIKVNKDTLSATCFSTNIKGDLITLVQEKIEDTFPNTLKTISNIIEFKPKQQIEIYVPFGGFFRNIGINKQERELSLETYTDDILQQYEKVPNLLFYKDGILPQIQMQYEIGYDVATNRITVPWRSFDGKLCGIMGRLNKQEVDEYETKWFPVIPFPKSKTLYGYSHNYKTIQEKGIIFVGESEKHVSQLASKGINIGLSLGGSYMSEVQADNIKSTFANKVIVMLDEGLEEDHSVEIAKKVKMDSLYKNNVGYVFDKYNQFMPKDSKLAPSDLDKKTLQSLIKNCTVWI